jgi:hypothetical protein
MRDAEQPSRESRGVVEFRQVLIGFQENVLTEIQRILAIRDQPQQIIEDTFLPSGHEEVIRLHISPPRLGDQVAIFHFAKDQLMLPLIVENRVSLSSIKTQPGRKKSRGR